MVDATAQMSANRATVEEAGAASAVTVRDYVAFAQSRIAAPSQSADWVRQWSAHVPVETVILDLRDEPRRAMLPLEVVTKGAVRIARFMGGSHANGNFPAADPGFSVSTQALADAARRSGTRIDLIHLERLLDAVAGQPNALAALPRQESANLALAVDLTGGFEEMLLRTSGKRKRKKHRSQTRKFEAAGGFRRVAGTSPAEVDRILDAFFAMKTERFAKAGIHNVFADPGVQDFFRSLFRGSLGETKPPFFLHGLEVDGTLRAVTGSSLCHDRMICEFGAIRDDELASTSPGDYLFFENIQEACSDGYAVYDFSVGDEFYKRLWCNIETRHFDVTVPVTAVGRVAAIAMRTQVGIKRFVKNNERLWSLVKTIRRKRAAQTAQPASDDADA